MPPYAPRLALPPPAPPPLCDCGAPSVWLRRRWLCARQGRGGCELRLSSEEERPCPDRADVLSSHSHLEPRPSAEGRGPREADASHSHLGPREPDAADAFVTVARGTAALLTACAYGPVNEWAFVGPSSAANTHRAPMTFGLGLFARVPLRAGQAVGEFSGPRLPLGWLRHPSLATLTVPSSQTFVDGLWEHSSFSGPIAPAIFAAPSSAAPNARREVWPSLRPQWTDRVRQRLWLVATEDIPAGAEIRFDVNGWLPKLSPSAGAVAGAVARAGVVSGLTARASPLELSPSAPPPPPPPLLPLPLPLPPPLPPLPAVAASPTTPPAVSSEVSPAVSPAPPPLPPPASPAALPPPTGAVAGASAAVLAATTVLAGGWVELCFRVVGQADVADAAVEETNAAVEETDAAVEETDMAVEETDMSHADMAVEETEMDHADAIADGEVAQAAQVAQVAQAAQAAQAVQSAPTADQQPSEVEEDEAHVMEDDAPAAVSIQEEAQAEEAPAEVEEDEEEAPAEAMAAMKEEVQVEEDNAHKKKKAAGDGLEKEDDDDSSVASTAVDDDGAGPRWRRVRRPCPPPTAAEPYVHRLAQLQSVAMLGSVEEQEALARAELDDEAQSIASGSMMRLQWETPLDGGDVRLRTLVPMLLADTATPASSASVGGSSTGSMSSFKAASWAMLATHLPGRSGRECRERWALLAPPHPPAPPRRSPVQLDALDGMHCRTRHDEL